MTTKTKLQNKIQELEAELVELKSQLSSYEEVTIETASVGDVLEDGSIVLLKSNGLALLVAPLGTEVEATWSKEFPEVFEALKEQGFNPSQWFIPTKEQLWLAYQSIPNEFALECDYWSSTEFDVTHAYGVDYLGDAGNINKSQKFCVRAFRCVTY
jgi:hypothetical protein